MNDALFKKLELALSKLDDIITARQIEAQQAQVAELRCQINNSNLRPAKKIKLLDFLRQYDPVC